MRADYDSRADALSIVLRDFKYLDSEEQVDDDSIVKENGHGSHPDDIIPPFDYIDEGGNQQRYPGKFVAVHQKQILAVGDSIPAVYAEAEAKSRLRSNAAFGTAAV